MTATILSLCASFISGVTLYFVQRFFKRREDKEKENLRGVLPYAQKGLGNHAGA